MEFAAEDCDFKHDCHVQGTPRSLFYHPELLLRCSEITINGSVFCYSSYKGANETQSLVYRRKTRFIIYFALCCNISCEVHTHTLHMLIIPFNAAARMLVRGFLQVRQAHTWEMHLFVSAWGTPTVGLTCTTVGGSPFGTTLVTISFVFVLYTCIMFC